MADTKYHVKDLDRVPRDVPDDVYLQLIDSFKKLSVEISDFNKDVEKIDNIWARGIRGRRKGEVGKDITIGIRAKEVQDFLDKASKSNVAEMRKLVKEWGKDKNEFRFSKNALHSLANTISMPSRKNQYSKSNYAKQAIKFREEINDLAATVLTGEDYDTRLRNGTGGRGKTRSPAKYKNPNTKILKDSLKDMEAMFQSVYEEYEKPIYVEQKQKVYKKQLKKTGPLKTSTPSQIKALFGQYPPAQWGTNVMGMTTSNTSNPYQVFANKGLRGHLSNAYTNWAIGQKSSIAFGRNLALPLNNPGYAGTGAQQMLARMVDEMGPWKISALKSKYAKEHKKPADEEENGRGNLGKTVATGLKAFNGGLMRATSIVNQFTESVGSAAEGFAGVIGNILTDPIGAMTSAIGGTGSLISGAMSGMSGATGMASDIFSSLAGMGGNILGGGGKEGGGMKGAGGGAMVAFTAVTSILSVISSIVSASFSMVSSIAGVLTKTVASSISGIWKAVKQMASYSPIMKAIFDLIQLGIALIFMPMFNVLGEKLIPIVTEGINFILGMWNTLTEWGNKIFTDDNVTVLKDFMTSILGLLFGTEDGTTKDLLELLKPVMETLMPQILGFINTMVAQLIKYFPQFTKFLGDAIELFNSFMSDDGLMESIFAFLREALGVFKDRKEDIIKIINQILDILPGLLHFATNVIGGITDVVGGSREFTADPIGLAKLALNQFGIKLAGGGVANNPPYGVPAIIGEAGPEAIIPLDKAGGFGSTYVIQFSGPVYGMDDFNNKVEKAVQKVTNKSYYR